MRTKPPARVRARHLALRPGVHVLRRSASELQVGLDARRALVLPDTPEVRALLRALAAPAAPPPDVPYDALTLEALAGSGLLVDLDLLLPLASTAPGAGTGTGPRPVSTTDVAALAAHAGDRAAALLEARRGSPVHLSTCGSPAATSVAEGVAGLLQGAGVPVEVLPHGRQPKEETIDASESSVTGLLVAVGEPERDLLDVWMRVGTPHLLVRLTEGQAVVGPFVLPGETACLRCVDAHHTDVDPAWPLLLTQYAGAVARPRDDTVPEPVDSALATLAGAWAARELVSHAEGRVPATASATVRLDPHLTAIETQRWPRHPACGCTWA